jgi:hypothetical protein
MEIFDISTLAALAFGSLAGILGYIGKGIRTDLRQIAVDLRAVGTRLSEYITKTESRLAVIEERLKEK